MIEEEYKDSDVQTLKIRKSEAKDDEGNMILFYFSVFLFCSRWKLVPRNKVSNMCSLELVLL